MKPTTLILLLTFLYFNVNAQFTQADSIQELPNDTSKVKAWIELIQRYRTNNYSLAETYADSAINLSNRINYLKGRAIALNEKGRAAMKQSNYKVAEECFLEALKYHDAMNERTKMATILNNLSIAKRDQAQFDEAMKYLFRSLSIVEEINDSTGIANAFTNIAVVYAIKLEHDRAREYFLKAHRIWKALGKYDRVNTIRLNLGGLLLETGHYDEAIVYVDSAKVYFEENGPQTELGRTHYLMGNIYLQTGELDKSEGHYLISKSIFDEIGNNMRATGCLLRLSSVAEKRGNFDEAVEYAKEALARNRELGIGNMQMRSLTQLYNLYKSNKNYEVALQYFEEAESLEDSLFSEEKDRQIADLESKYQSEVKERELAESRADIEVQQMLIKRQKVQQSILIGVIVGVIVILLLLWYQFRTNRRNNLILREKNALIHKSLGEKEVLLKEIHHRVKNNLQFISSMLNLQARHVSDPEALEVLKEGKNRIQSMALVHQKLYQEENLKGVNMEEYINNLVDGLIHSYKIPDDQIEINVKVEPVVLDIDTAMPIGLIINELITNSFKHGFNQGDKGEVEVSLLNKEGQMELMIKDSGKGLPDDFNPEKPDKFGFRLVRSLSEKLGAEPEVITNGGLSVKLQFNNPKAV